MTIGVIREVGQPANPLAQPLPPTVGQALPPANRPKAGVAHDHRVALTPAVVRRLVSAGHTVWVEAGAGDGAMFSDNEYIRAGAHIGYSPADVIHRARLLPKISRPSPEELAWCPPDCTVMAFYHMPVADRALLQALAARGVTAIGCEIVEQDDGRLPILAAISEIAGQMTVPIAAHLLRSSSGGRGILLGGAPGVPPARIVVLGVGSVGFAAVRGAAAAGAHVTAFDRDPRKLHHIMNHIHGADTCLADPDAIAEAVAQADVVIGAVLIAGARTPHIVTRQMVESMKPGSAILDVSIDQGGCVETSRPTTLADPTFVHHGVTHFCVPNFTADLGRTSSIAIAQAMLPYLLSIARHGVTLAIEKCPDLRRGVAHPVTQAHGLQEAGQAEGQPADSPVPVVQAHALQQAGPAEGQPADSPVPVTQAHGLQEAGPAEGRTADSPVPVVQAHALQEPGPAEGRTADSPVPVVQAHALQQAGPAEGQPALSRRVPGARS
jgi:alanine dehydrogenase